MNQEVQELLAKLTVPRGDFVTLSHEEAALAREIMQRRIPIEVDTEANHSLHNTAFHLGFDQNAR